MTKSMIVIPTKRFIILLVIMSLSIIGNAITVLLVLNLVNDRGAARTQETQKLVCTLEALPRLPRAYEQMLKSLGYDCSTFKLPKPVTTPRRHGHAVAPVPVAPAPARTPARPAPQPASDVTTVATIIISKPTVVKTITPRPSPAVSSSSRPRPQPTRTSSHPPQPSPSSTPHPGPIPTACVGVGGLLQVCTG